jgi:hypothetical protein
MLIEQNASDEFLSEFHFANRLIELTDFYRRESILCFEGKALFAAGVLAASALESLLIQFCLSDKANVVESVTWKSLKNAKYGSFLEALRQNSRVGLDKLLSLANELGWFPTGPISDKISTKLIEDFGEENRSDILEFLSDFQTVDELFEVMSELAKNSRNYVHPAVCIRSELKIKDLTGKETFFSALFVLTLLHVKVDEMFNAIMVLQNAAAKSAVTGA